MVGGWLVFMGTWALCDVPHDLLCGCALGAGIQRHLRDIEKEVF